MNDLQVRKSYADGLRTVLLENVAAQKPQKKTRWWIGITAAAILAISGTTGIATAHLATPPGTPIVNTIGTPATGTFQGTGTLDLGPVPAGANGIKVTVKCLTAGSFTFGEFGTMACTEGKYGKLAWGIVPLTLDQQRKVTLTTTPEASWSIEASYTKTIDTDWGINDAGQTFGAIKGADKYPDLIPVYTTDCQQGYANSAFIDSLGPTGMTWDEAEAYRLGPNRFDRFIPVYTSDGHTIIGEIVQPGTDSPHYFQHCPDEVASNGTDSASPPAPSPTDQQEPWSTYSGEQYQESVVDWANPDDETIRFHFLSSTNCPTALGAIDRIDDSTINIHVDRHLEESCDTYGTLETYQAKLPSGLDSNEPIQVLINGVNATELDDR